LFHLASMEFDRLLLFSTHPNVFTRIINKPNKSLKIPIWNIEARKDFSKSYSGVCTGKPKNWGSNVQERDTVGSPRSQAALPPCALHLHLHKRQDEVVSPRHRCYSYLRAARGGGDPASRFPCQDSGTRLLGSSLPSRSNRRPAAPPFAIARYTSCPFSLWGFFFPPAPGFRTLEHQF
jgi:hypothetical protein